MARGSYRQLHEVVHPELLHIKRQQQQNQQQLTDVLAALRESNIVIERLTAKVTLSHPFTFCRSVIRHCLVDAAADSIRLLQCLGRGAGTCCCGSRTGS